VLHGFYHPLHQLSLQSHHIHQVGWCGGGCSGSGWPCSGSGSASSSSSSAPGPLGGGGGGVTTTMEGKTLDNVTHQPIESDTSMKILLII
jgi:hypothetical protein